MARGGSSSGGTGKIVTFLLTTILAISPTIFAGPTGPSDYTEVVLDEGLTDIAPATVAVNPDDTAELWGVGCQDANVTAYHSTDSGSTWVGQVVETNRSDDGGCDVDVLDSSNIAISWVEGGSQSIFSAVSSDGGSTWNTAEAVGSSGLNTPWVSAIGWVDASNLWIMWRQNDNVRAKYSTDGGNSWIPSNGGGSLGQNDIAQGANNAIYEHGSSHMQYNPEDRSEVRYLSDDTTAVSTDGGQTWSSVHSANQTGVAQGFVFEMIDTDTWLYGGETSGQLEVYLTNDAGQSWTTLHTLAPNATLQAVRSISAPDTTNIAVGMAVTCGGTACLANYYTADGGSTWTESQVSKEGQTATEGEYVLHPEADYYVAWGGSDVNQTRWAWSFGSGGSSTPPGLDTFTPAEADQEDTTTWFNIGHLETDWTNDTASHEVYVRGLTGIQGTDNEVRLRVYNPSLDQVRQTNACAAYGYAEARSMQTRHTLTRETNERVVYPCDQMGDPQQDAFILINGTSFDLVNDGDLDAVMSDPWTPTVTSCNSPTRCITDAAEDNQVVKWDALNMQSNWIKPLSVEDVAADKNGNDRYGIVGGFGERVYGPSGNVIANGPGFGTLKATALFNATTLYGGDQNAVVKMTCSGSSCTTSAINTTLGTVEHGLRLSKDGNYIMALSPNRERVSIYDTTDLSRIVDANMGETVKGFDMDLTNTYLYVAEDTDLYRFDLTGTNVTQNTATPPEAPAQTGNVTSNVTTPTGSGQPSFDTILEQQAASAFNVDAVGAGWILGGLFIVILSLAGAAMLGNAGVQTQTGATVGAVGGLALSIAFNWIPIWFVVVLGLIAAAFVVSRRG